MSDLCYLGKTRITTFETNIFYSNSFGTLPYFFESSQDRWFGLHDDPGLLFVRGLRAGLGLCGRCLQV